MAWSEYLRRVPGPPRDPLLLSADPQPQRLEQARPEEHDVEGDHEPHSPLGEYVQEPPVPAAIHEPLVIDEQDHEHEDDREEQPLEVLRADVHRDRVDPRDEDDERPNASTNV
jgi:hypothetical protein